MSFPDAFGAPYVTSTGIQFPMLKMKDLAAIAKTVETRRRDRLSRTADSNQLKGESRARFIAVGEAEDVDIFQITQYAGSFEGSIDVARRSLKAGGKSDSEAAAIAEELTPDELRNIALWVVGAIRPEKPEGEKGPNP
jgi:hypothetical protein